MGYQVSPMDLPADNTGRWAECVCSLEIYAVSAPASDCTVSRCPCETTPIKAHFEKSFSGRSRRRCPQQGSHDKKTLGAGSEKLRRQCPAARIDVGGKIPEKLCCLSTGSKAPSWHPLCAQGLLLLHDVLPSESRPARFLSVSKLFDLLFLFRWPRIQVIKSSIS